MTLLTYVIFYFIMGILLSLYESIKYFTINPYNKRQFKKHWFVVLGIYLITEIVMIVIWPVEIYRSIRSSKNV